MMEIQGALQSGVNQTVIACWPELFKNSVSQAMLGHADIKGPSASPVGHALSRGEAPDADLCTVSTFFKTSVGIQLISPNSWAVVCQS